MVFFIDKFNKKNTQFEQVSKRPFHHFGQIDFDMSIVTRVIFFTSKVWTI
jgi:hypothetical protein